MEIPSVNEVEFDKHYWSTSSNEIKQIAKPLERHGITYFCYSRLHSNGVDDTLLTEPLAQKIFIDMKAYEHVYFGEIDQYSPCIVRWDDMAIANDSVKKSINCMRNELNIGNGITIVMPRDHYVEFYNMASTVQDYKINSFYLSNIEYLYAFIDYFDNVALELKEHSFQHRVYYPDHGDSSLLTSIAEMSNLNLKKMDFGKTFKAMADFYRLTARERECACLLMKGLNCKKISGHLGISARTTEKYLQNLRYKTKSINFCQMLSKLFRIKNRDIDDD